jgi:hypothetical protein
VSAAGGEGQEDTDRSLAALGMDGVPALDPLSYPGRVVTQPALLCESRLLDVAATAARAGLWPVSEGDGGGGTARPRSLDEVLGELGQPSAGKRHPVIAIGSNAAPGQLHHKLSRLGLPAVVPMMPLRVSGLGVGVSAHVAMNGYVANSPYADPGGVADVVLTLVDADQLRAVDDTEIPRYRRVLLPGAEFPMVLPSGERLAGAYLYVNAAGVLAGADGKPLTPTTQTELLADLLTRSERLRHLFASPQDWVDKALAEPASRAAAQQVFRDSGWVLPQDALLRHACEPGSSGAAFDTVSPMATDGTSP